MSKIITDAIGSRTKPGYPPNVDKADFVKVWGGIDGPLATPGYWVSFGTSSLVDMAIGRYKVGFATPFLTTQFAPVVCHVGGFAGPLDFNPSNVTLRVRGPTGTDIDEYPSFQIAGYLA